jgi:hypothetical protein
MKINLFKIFGLLLVAGLVFSSCRNEDNKIEETCFDEIKNQNEFRVDCGGVCPPCEPTCDDGYRNQDEQSPETGLNGAAVVVGIDCGGETCEPCATCSDGIQNAHWVLLPGRDREDFEFTIPNDTMGLDSMLNVYQLVMEVGVDCGFPCSTACVPACDDGIQNGDEEGVDCGGSCGAPCPPPTCNDGIQNGTETGIDCGDLATLGMACGDCPDPTCNDGIQNIHIEVNEDFPLGYVVVVETGIDCDDNPQTECPDCPIPTCFDGVQNGIELGIDCGPGCGVQCFDVPNCNNGIQDGDEAGIDCDFDDTTPCPPCAACDDEVKNGPELEVDCVDYPIPQYPCPQCISCHDNIQNPENFELDVDCGGPDCDRCPEFLIVQSIAGTAFTDQYTYNRALAQAGNTDTLELDHQLYPGLKVEKIPGGFTPAHILVTANQGIQTAEGLIVRTVELRIPYPETTFDEATQTMIDGPVDMTNQPQPDPGFCGPLIVEGDDIPYFTYKVVLVDNTSLLNNCYLSYEDDGQNSELVYTYLFSSLEGTTERLVKGNINEGSIRTAEDFISGEALDDTYSNLQFQFAYPYFP